MSSRRRPFSLNHPVVVLFVIIAIVASMGLAAEVLKPLALSILLAFALTPIARLMERRGLPHVPAVVITVALALGGLGVVGYVVAGQLDRLAGDLSDPRRIKNMEAKLSFLNPVEKSNLTRATESVQQVAETLDADPSKAATDDAPSKAATDATPKEAAPKPVQEVRVVEQPKFRERLEDAIGPYFESLTVGSFVLILVLFMMVGREDLGNRIVSLFGKRQITLTTRTMNEVADRISRYLATNALVNAGFGLVIGVGLHFIGVPYAVLWGVMAALLRFIPYVGTVIAFGLPALYATATFPGWSQVLWFLGLFLLVETALNSFLEPIIYGKTTGVSALGLLVAAMFWTWLWGIWGLVLSTPMTVCLAVLGKYVPSLGFFATILGEESELEPYVRYYQKLLALDQDAAIEGVEEFLKSHPRAELFEDVLIPALTKAERDFARGEIDEREQAYVWRVTDEVLDELEGTPEITLGGGDQAKTPPSTAVTVVGVPANDRSDFLVLRMLKLLIEPSSCKMTILAEGQSPMEMADEIREMKADAVLLSHLPPAGLTNARYLVRRLHGGVEGTRIIVGRWGEGGDTDGATERLTGAGAAEVVFNLSDARARLLPAGPASKVIDEPKLKPALA